METAWLVHDTRVLASAELASTRAERRNGLLGRESLDGVLVLAVRAVHTIGMRFAIDVAYCDGDGVLLRVVTMAPNRIGRPCWAATQVIEAPAGSFRSWGLGPGERIEIR